MSDRDFEEQTRVRYLRRAMHEADRLTEELDLPRDVREIATEIYRELREEGLLPGRAIEEVVGAAIYLGCKMEDIPRTPGEIADCSEYSRKDILRTSKYLNEVLELGTTPTDPQPYAERFCEELNLSTETKAKSEEFIRFATNENLAIGKSPSAIAAGAVYAATQYTTDKITQAEMSSIADVSEVTIRNRYKEQLAAYDEHDN